MKKHLLAISALLSLVVVGSCGGDSASQTELRARLINQPEDYYLVLCGTGEKLWVDLHTLQPWWSQLSVDGGHGLAPIMYVHMRAKVETNGPYGHADKTTRAVVEVDEMFTISSTIPSDCSQ